ncbi:MAG: pyridoxine 5'-phosphate synthase, partial [Oscillospiraceae bacterium]|nr:pyridoxine 5'-phosphate synthase [Oscillospiraceae bacterium]
AALAAHSVGLGLNAGHDLNLKNLKFFQQHVPHLMEVSIGHAHIAYPVRARATTPRATPPVPMSAFRRDRNPASPARTAARSSPGSTRT